jgi:hypothetical protein
MSRLQDITTFTDTEINDLDYFWVNEIETSTATLSIASPCVVSKTAHNLEVGNKISFTTTGALPTGLTASTNYYIISSGFGANSFRLSATFGGTAINTSGTQSGVHTYTAYVSKKMSGEKLKTLVVPSTPASEVAFDKLTPTTAGVVFTPNTPTTTNILYYSTIDGSTWIYNGTIYKSKAIPNSTEFNIDGIFVDAGSNKTSTISRNGNLKVRENNTLLSKFTEILSYGISIVSDTFAQISQTAVSTTVYPLTRMTRKRGTITSQTNALSGDTLGMMAWNGGSANDSVQIFAQATENNAGTIGASLYFQTVQTGSSGLSTAFWIDGTAKVNISLGSVYTYATANTLSGFDASKNLVSLSTATYPSLTELSYVKGLTAPVGTLATQSTVPVVIQLACSDETTALTTGTSKVTFRMPHAMTLTEVRASLNVAGTTSGITTIDINEGGTSILSTKLTIDLTEKTSTTAATPAVISDASLADDAEITIDIDAISGGATEKGLKITLIGTRSV